MSTDDASKPTVVLALPDRLLASALAAALSSACSVTGTVESWADLEDALDQHRPEVAAVGVVVGNDHLLAHLHQLVASYHGTEFVVCATHVDEVLIERVFLAGAAGILDHEGTAAQMAAALLATCRAEPWPKGYGAPSLRYSGSRAPLKALTVRQRQLAELLWLGHTHREISESLNCSVKTVESHVAAVRRAFGVPRGLPGPWEHSHRGGQPRKA